MAKENIRVRDIENVYEEVTVAVRDVHEGFTAEKVSAPLAQIKSKLLKHKSMTGAARTMRCLLRRRRIVFWLREICGRANWARKSISDSNLANLLTGLGIAANKIAEEQWMIICYSKKCQFP